jgi:hypothetical protein
VVAVIGLGICELFFWAMPGSTRIVDGGEYLSSQENPVLEIDSAISQVAHRNKQSAAQSLSHSPLASAMQPKAVKLLLLAQQERGQDRSLVWALLWQNGKIGQAQKLLFVRRSRLIPTSAPPTTTWALF